MRLADVTTRTGWILHHLRVAPSTNDVALGLLAQGAAARTVVVADRQTEGRGRARRSFASPPGGLYASLLVAAGPRDLPARVVGLVAVAAAEALDAATGERASIKWPNDLWLGGRKVGGILLEVADPTRPVVAGLGINVRAVPAALPAALREGLTCVDAIAGRRTSRGQLLVDLLRGIDAWQAGDEEALADAWRKRLALIGEEIVCTCAGEPLRGVLEEAHLSRGLLIRDALSGPVWRPAEHVQDLQAAGRTIS